jgi:N6-L-threonylcarbamoyladenine synthase/ribosomal-protein-alanine N-acetyltransferase
VQASDLGAVAAMWARLYRAAEPLEAGSEGALDAAGLQEATARWARQLADGDEAFGLILCDRAGSPLGFAGCTLWSRGWSRRGLVGSINALWVEPPLRRQGMGRALAAAAMLQLRARGAAVLEVQALASNPGAQAFWRDLGFGEKAVVLRA